MIAEDRLLIQLSNADKVAVARVDLVAGQALTPGAPPLVLATASGQRSRSEEHGMGDNEFLPWQIGAVM